jgi:predicted ArsR family transcriptional regulator
MTRRRKTPEKPQRFSYQGLDRVIHERARLGILASLLAHPKGLVFGELLDVCELTDGNLSRHLQVLQAAKLVNVRREVGLGRPQTICRLTSSGRKRFLDYLAVLEQVLLDATDARNIGSGSDSALVPARN